ncbi:MAG: polysaccharide deacetylase family protein [Planctomycetota bacterium]
MHARVCLAGVPVMIFHSVRRHALAELGALTLAEPDFEQQMRSLARAGYAAITCRELHDHLVRDAPLPRRPILLTFDDGYLDNFTVAGPVLARHGLRATVFVATDGLHTGRDVRRATSDDEHASEHGMLSPAELCAMEASGVFEIQAHSASHARLPVSGAIESFDVPSGAPRLRTGWMGEVRAFVPEPELEAAARAFVREHGAARFFERASWRAELERVCAPFLEDGGARGRHETDDERRTRLRDDLARGKRRLEDILGHAVDFLAWPGGGSSALALDVALQDVGFRATFGTNRVCAGVEPSPRAIPRAYFNQSYRGGLARFARVAKFRGVADYESRRPLGYLRVFAANRLMQLFAKGDDR